MADESKQAIPGQASPGWAQGMTLREWYAGLAMQGMISGALAAGNNLKWEVMTAGAIQAADALLAALKESAP